MTRAASPLLLLVGLAAVATVASAGKPVDETRNASADGYVSIENLMGSVRVTGWAKDQIHVTGTLGDGVEGLDVETSGDRTHIEVIHPDRMMKRSWEKGEAESDLEISVPQGSDVRVNGVNLDIEVSGVKGELELESVNGSVSASGSSKEVQASAVNGTISLDVEAVRIQAEAVNGAITVAGGSGELETSCVNGTIEVTGGSFDEASCSTVSGDITWAAGLDKRGSLSLDSHSGSVLLRLPKSIDAEFDVSTFSGKIVNELGPEAERSDPYAPGYELSFTLGNGSAQIDVSSFSGRVEIRAGK